jgi:hypothetical protein
MQKGMEKVKVMAKGAGSERGPGIVGGRRRPPAARRCDSFEEMLSSLTSLRTLGSMHAALRC